MSIVHIGSGTERPCRLDYMVLCVSHVSMIQEHQRLHGALYALRLMTRKYEFRDADDRIPLDAIVKTTFPTLLQVFQVSVYLFAACCLPLLSSNTTSCMWLLADSIMKAIATVQP